MKLIYTWSALIVLYLLPFVSTDLLFDAGLSLQNGLLIGLNICFALLILINTRTYHAYNPKTFVCIAVFIICYIVSFFYAYQQTEAFASIVRVTTFAIALFLFQFLVQNDLIRMKLLGKGMILYSILVSISYVVEISLSEYSIHEILMNKNLYSIVTLFGNKNLYASYAVLLCVLSILQFHKHNKFWRVIIIFSVTIGLSTILFTQTKAVYLALIVSAIVTTTLVFVKNSTRTVRLFLLICISVIGISGLILVVANQDKFSVLLSTNTFTERILVWENTMKLIFENPFLGVGAGNWQVFFPKYGLDAFDQTNYLIPDGYLTFQRPHNDFLWIWSEGGVLPFIIYVTLFLVLIYNAISDYTHSASFAEKWEAVFKLILMCVYVVIAFFDFPFERTTHQYLFVLLLVFYHKKNNDIVPKPNRIKLILIGFILVSLISGYICVNRIKAEMDTKKMMQTYQKMQWANALVEYGDINQAYYQQDNNSIPISWYAGTASMALGNAKIALLYYKEAYEIAPYQINVINNLAAAYEQLGMHKLAIRYYKKSLEISSIQHEANINYAAVLYNMDSIVSAFQAVSQFPFHPNNHQLRIYLEKIVPAYIQYCEENEIELPNKQLVNTIKHFPDSIFLMHEFYTKNNTTFANEILINKQ